MCVPVSIGFDETALVPARIEYSAWQMCVRERKLSTSTCGISTSGTWLPGEESANDAGPWMDHGTWDCSLEPERMLYPVRQLKLYIQDSEIIQGGWRQRMFIHWNRSIREIMRSHISRWIVETVKETYTQADRQYDQVTAHEVRALLHGRTTVRWLYLTSCQRLFGGHLGSSRTRTWATWPVLLRACRHWVQWWSHNTSWIQDIFTHLHSLHDLYAATAMTFLMKNTWLLAGIFMYGTE